MQNKNVNMIMHGSIKHWHQITSTDDCYNKIWIVHFVACMKYQLSYGITDVTVMQKNFRFSFRLICWRFKGTFSLNIYGGSGWRGRGASPVFVRGVPHLKLPKDWMLLYASNHISACCAVHWIIAQFTIIATKTSCPCQRCASVKVI